MTSSDDSSEQVARKHRKREKSSKKHKKRSKKDHKKKRQRDRSPSSSSDEDSYEEKRRRKKEHKKSRKHSRESRDERPDPLERNYALADALCSLFDMHPALSSDLPVMLVRLARGTTFDLGQMTDTSAAQGLSKVFGCLEAFGVQQDANGAWQWQGPPGANELLLIRVIRTMLDQIGVSMDAINTFEEIPKEPIVPAVIVQPDKPREAAIDSTSLVQEQTKALLQQFTQGNLAKELAQLCQLIMGGESLSLDSLPDEKLRNGLESLFVECGLEKSEMEDDDDDDSDDGATDDNSPSMGYSLPESREDTARARLSSILQVCEGKPAAARTATAGRRPIKGPMRTPEAYADDTQGQEDDDDSDDEGPLPAGVRPKGPVLDPELVKLRAAQRARELHGVKGGMDAGDIPPEGEGREEWMLVPGKHDFLSGVKAGQPMRSRTFGAQSKGDAGHPSASQQQSQQQPVNPKIKAEMEAIMQAHSDSRGLSLVEQHRQEKAQAQKEKESTGDNSWTWSRDKDLDSGRRVDKNALNMVYGGAADNLKKKFAGGFSGR